MTSTSPDLNYGDLLEAIGRAVPERTAIVCGDQRISWGELDLQSNRVARWLLSKGLQPDSKVAFYLRNSPAYVTLFVACAKARCVHANVNYRYVDHELLYLFDNADARAIVYDAEFRPVLERLKGQLAPETRFLEVGQDKPPSWADSYDETIAQGDATPLGNTRSGDDLYFMYTGGTTGYPKAVMWPHRERIAVIGMATADTAAQHAANVAGAGTWPVAIPAAPLMHSTGLTTMLSTLCAGGTVVLLASPSFDARACCIAIETNRVERMAIVGDAFSVPLLGYLREHGSRHDLSSMQLISSAGAMWSEQFKQELLDYFPEAVLSDSLGSSEGSRIGAATTRRGESSSTGRFELGPNVKVFREDFTEVEAGSGEAGMLAKGGPLPLGYYKDPERTAKTFPVVNGVRYSLAGDWCRVEADGTMTLLGRGNNCINTGGEKVYPEEVEDVLKTLPSIVDAAVVGMPDDRWGNIVTALIRTSTDEPPDLGAIKAGLSERLAGYKHPRRIEHVTEDFRHDNGKINYRVARAMMAARLNPNEGADE